MEEESPEDIVDKEKLKKTHRIIADSRVAMKLNCKELQCFHLLGGTLTCDYDKQIARIDDTAFKCHIKPEDHIRFQMEFAYNKNKKDTLKYDAADENYMDKIITSEIKRVNLLNNEYGFIIENPQSIRFYNYPSNVSQPST